jgi:hypothetical protein
MTVALIPKALPAERRRSQGKHFKYSVTSKILLIIDRHINRNAERGRGKIGRQRIKRLISHNSREHPE